jgi:hypothetical protein
MKAPMRILILVLGLALCQGAKGQAKAPDDNARLRTAISQGDDVFPHDWRFLILGENAWHSVTSKRTDAAFTVRNLRTTYIRQSYMDSSTIQEIRRALLHEAGHVHCSCGNERVADAFAEAHR